MTNKPTELVVTQADINAWEVYGPRIFHCEMTGPEALAAHRLASTAPASQTARERAEAIFLNWSHGFKDEALEEVARLIEGVVTKSQGANPVLECEWIGEFKNCRFHSTAEGVLL